MKKPSFSITVAMLACLGMATSMAFAGGSPRKAFGKQNPFRAEELPAGKLKANLQSLDPQAKDRAMKWLHTFDFDATDAAEHLRVDNGGGIYIVCPDDQDNCENRSPKTATPGAIQDSSSATGSIVPGSAQTADAPTIANAAVSASSPPVYHSRPASTKHIYLDFNGGIVSGTAWNSGGSSWDVKVWSQDTDRTTFNDAEQTWMYSIWQRVAEDYAPFDVDVTTDVAFDPDNYTGNKDNVGWLLICETTDNNGVALPHNGSGGVAYVGVFGDSTYSPTYQPAWVTSTNGGGSESIIAEAASHEMGHNMGLSHDGTSTLSYYGGHGSGDVSWGPLMGTGYNRNVSQWSKGEYYDANLHEDDLAIINARVPYRADDHGNTAGTATPLTITGGTTISSTTPQNDPYNSNPANKGVIERNTDVDVFSFYTGAGTVQLNANPWIMPSGTRGGNLDILLELYNETGTLVASNNAANLTSAAISTTVTQGYYNLYVRNTGTGSPLVSPPSGYTAYGSIGQYFLSGTIVDANLPLVVTGIAPASGIAGTTVTVDLTGTGISADTTIKLTRSGHADLPATSVQLIGSGLRCQLSLAGADAGAWDVVATNPDLETSVLPAAFTVTSAIWAENFDGAVSGWTSDSSFGTNSWSLTTAQSQSPNTSYFAAGPSSRSTTNLNSPEIPIPANATGLEIKFWHSYNLQTSNGGQSARDGGVLEFSINNGVWFDVISSGSGASFASNGYNLTISTSTNDLNARQAWSGNSNGFVETAIDLTDTAKYAGANLRMRWRIATNSNGASNGWYVDGISLFGNAGVPNQPPVITIAASTPSLETETDPDTTVYQIIRNTGTDLSVAATDDGGEPALTYTWSVTSGPATPVIFTANGTNAAKNTHATFQTAGDYQISVSISDAASLAVTSSVNVRVHQTGNGLVITPASATVEFQSNRQFGAILLDQFGTPMASQPASFSWSASGGGTIEPTGLYSATSAGGPYVISAASGSISNTASVTVTPAPASISFTNLIQTYDGNPKHVTVTTDPAASFAVTYDTLPEAPTNAGTYIVEATITDPDYQGTTSDSFLISMAPQTIGFAPLAAVTFGDDAFALSAAASSGLTVSYASSDPLVATVSGNTVTIIGAGSTTLTASQAGDTNFEAATDVPQSLTVNKANATVTLSNLTQTFDGTPKHVTVTTDPADRPVTVTYDGLPDEPVGAGTHAVVATVDDPNYEGTSSGSLVIEPGNDLVSWRNKNFTPAEQTDGLAANDADPDFDKLSNLAEYALGTDPRVFSPPPVPTLDANGLSLTFTRPFNLPNLFYAAESSDELGIWSPIPLEILTPGDPETVRARDPLTTGDPSKRFLRLRFETP